MAAKLLVMTVILSFLKTNSWANIVLVVPEFKAMIALGRRTHCRVGLSKQDLHLLYRHGLV